MSRSYKITLNITHVKVTKKRNIEDEPSVNNKVGSKKKLQGKQR